jgi:hypothetical protein
MKYSLKRIAAGMTTVATVGTMLLSAPVHAATATGVSDTLTRVKISETATHQFAGTFGTTIGQFQLVMMDYGTAGFSLTPSSPSCSFASGTCTAATVATGTNITCTAAAGCSGAITLGTFAGTNPGTAGSKTVTMSGTGGYTGSFAIAIVDDDQVTVTASVDPSITFDLDTSVAHGDNNPPYVVALGTLTPTDTRVSGATDGVNHIWMDLDTNASGGAVVTVRNLNGADGLSSTSVPTDDIESTDSSVADGTEDYGLCVVAVSQTTGTLAIAGDYVGETCAADTEGNTVEGLSTTAAAIINTSGAPISGGSAQIAVQAAISGVTPAHNDYTDTLTFVATGTF